MITLYAQQADFLKFAVDNKGAASESEIIRWALDDYKKSHYPDYIWKLTPGQEDKKKKLEKDKTFLDASPEKYAEYIQSPIRKNTDGYDMAFIYFSDWKKPTPVALKQLKQFAKQFPADIENHLNRVKTEGPVEKHLKVGEEYSSNFGFTSTIAE